MSISKRLSEAVESLLKSNASAIGARAENIKRAYLPELKKELLSEVQLRIVPAAIGGSGTQDVSSELVDYAIGLGVSRNTVSNDTAKQDSITDVVEKAQDVIAAVANQQLILPAEGQDPACEVVLNLPFTSEPLYSPELLRESGIYLSLTVFNFHVDRYRS